MKASETKADWPTFFIVGNSRSGTTMMMRIANNHSEVHSINEPHFFEKLWSPDDGEKSISRKEAFQLYAKLFTGQRAGFFEPVEKHVESYRSETESILGSYDQPLSRLGVYRHFIHYEARKNGKSIPCEKTPQNVFYISEILEHFPNARIINMVRDPRGVMLSQKRKWKRKFLGADFITRREMWRLRINYHPITISKLWNAAIGAVQAFEGEARLMNVRFEDLLAEPEETVKAICNFLGIAYEAEMLLVPHAGSSSEADRKDSLGIKKTRAKGWLDKGLSHTEIGICQRTCKKYMDQYGYEAIDVKSRVLANAWHHLNFPFKIALALIVNVKRMRSIGDTLKRRLSPK